LPSFFFVNFKESGKQKQPWRTQFWSSNSCNGGHTGLNSSLYEGPEGIWYSIYC